MILTFQSILELAGGCVGAVLIAPLCGCASSFTFAFHVNPLEYERDDFLRVYVSVPCNVLDGLRRETRTMALEFVRLKRKKVKQLRLPLGLGSGIFKRMIGPIIKQNIFELFSVSCSTVLKTQFNSKSARFPPVG